MNEDKKLKRNLFLFIGLAIIGIIYVIFAGFVNQGVEKTGVFKNDAYIYIKDFLIWHVDNGKYLQETEVPNDANEFEYTIYNGTKKLKAASAQFYNQKWYFYDKNYKELSTDNFRIAYTGLKNDIKITAYDTESYDESDDDIIDEVVGDIDYSQLRLIMSSLLKTYVDLDKDGDNEVIYTFSDNKLDVLDYTPTTYLVLVRNDKVLDVVKENGSTYNFELQEIADLDGNGTYELIVSNDVRNVPTFESCYQIYNADDDKLSLTQNCMLDEE